MFANVNKMNLENTKKILKSTYQINDDISFLEIEQIENLIQELLSERIPKLDRFVLEQTQGKYNSFPEYLNKEKEISLTGEAINVFLECQNLEKLKNELNS